MNRYVVVYGRKFKTIEFLANDDNTAISLVKRWKINGLREILRNEKVIFQTQYC